MPDPDFAPVFPNFRRHKSPLPVLYNDGPGIIGGIVTVGLDAVRILKLEILL